MACCPQGDSFVSPWAKYVLFFFNFLFWLCGGVMIGVGIWAYVEKNKYYYQDIETIYDVLLDLSILLMIVGSITFIVGYAGCVGALRENICLLRILFVFRNFNFIQGFRCITHIQNSTYPDQIASEKPVDLNLFCYLQKWYIWVQYGFYCIIMLIFLMELTIVVLAFVFQGKVKDWVKEILQEGMILRYQDDEDAVMDWFQETIKCCGIDGYKDWNKNIYFNCTRTNPSGLRCGVPYSCCRNQDALSAGIVNILCGANALDDSDKFDATDNIYTIGCVDALIQLAESNLPVLGGVVIGLAVPQLLGICLGRLLSGQIQDQKDRWRLSRRH